MSIIADEAQSTYDEAEILHHQAQTTKELEVFGFIDANSLVGNVTIGEGCYIGMGTNVIQGRTIGSWTVVGAGAVVVQNLPANVTAVGVPAKVIKIREKGWHEE